MLSTLQHSSRRLALSITTLASLLFAGGSAHAAEPKWIRISSDHFSVLTDAGQKKGHEVAARFEQMRAVFAQLLMRNKLQMSEPIEIIAVENPADYAKMVPFVNGRPISAPGFFLAGEDRDFIVLNTAIPDSWRAIEHPFAHYLLDYNYPPTPSWFDEGVAEYFASLYFTSKKSELGSDPELQWPGQANFSADPGGGGLKSLTEILDAPVWLDFSDLLQMKNRVVDGREGTHHTLFYAQSWMLVHYLLNENKLPQAGRYFGLVENQHVSVVDAVPQAFGMTISQLDRAVKNYFHSLKALDDALFESRQASSPLTPEPVRELPLPFTIDEVSDSTADVPAREADALIAEMKLRIPELRKQAAQDLEQLASDPKTETAVAHRALAWDYVQKGDTQKAFAELHSALDLDPADAWAHFGVALAAYHSAQKGTYIQGLANTMESLHYVTDQFREFAEAYDILGWARLQGGGANSAVEAMKIAVQLSPRDESYQLRLARAYLAAKKFEEATAILESLQHSENDQVAGSARKDLQDLPFLKKYGVSPEEQAARQRATETEANASMVDTEEDENPLAKKPAPARLEPDKRPVRFLKGTLLSVDCSQAPVGILKVADGKVVRKLRADNYKSLAVIGAKEFSCEWKNVPVNVNYRPGGKADGDLVSVELR
jgi:tetratricopeptide (TPR) repeat protein